MYLGYNTNGMAHHGLFDAIRLLAEIGYGGVAITIDHGVLAPCDGGVGEQIVELRRLLDTLTMHSVIETGARFLLDPRQKHEPTLISPDPQARMRRVAFYKHAIDCAAELGSDCVSLWSGRLRDGASPAEAMDRLVEGLGETLDYAQRRKVVVGFEPEPGMLVDSMESYVSLLERIDRQDFRLTLDLGHLRCQGEKPAAEIIRRWSPRLVNVHIEDMRTGVHEHLMFGQGEMDFPPIIEALAEAGYRGGVYVELSRHSHMAPQAARQVMEFLRPLMEGR